MTPDFASATLYKSLGRAGARALLVVAIMLGAASPAGAAGPESPPHRFTFFALGDLPYRLPEEDIAFTALINAINARAPAFSIHIGDFKGGRAPCTDALFARMAARFDSFRQPLIYTPGDNEWTDCHRFAAGGYDPLERLARLREVFFAGPQSLGARTLPLIRQGDVTARAKWRIFVENARWVYQGVVFATLHVVGSNNNRRSGAEFARRDAANSAWIAAAFAEARRRRAPAMVFAFQGNPKPGRSRRSGYRSIVDALVDGARGFAGAVLVIHGDQHRYIVDRPFSGPDGSRLDNFTRLQVMGSPRIGAVQVTVSVDADRARFAFQPLYPP
jgi:hypothetical protein